MEITTEVTNLLGRYKNNNPTRHGKVKFFRRELPLFGFIIPEDGGREVFFHLNQGCHVEFDGGPDPVLLNGCWPHPKAADRIAYITEEKEKGPQASRWVLIEEGKIRDIIERIHGRNSFRLIRRTGSQPATRLYNPLQYTHEILWEGNNLREFRRKWSKHVFGCFENSSLAMYIEIYLDGVWKRVEKDPR